MPKPELYMIFTGDRKRIPDTISLSEEFFVGEKISIDAEVKVLYQENGNNIIGQYIIFSKVYNEHHQIMSSSYPQPPVPCFHFISSAWILQ